MTNIPRQQLKYLITQFGRSLCDDPKRCEALLKDVCPNHKREVNLLVAALREGAAKELLNATALIPLESTIKRIANKIHDNLGTAEHLAQWAVESWALALGLMFKPSSPYVAQQNTGNVPQKPIPQAIIDQFKGWQKIGTNGKQLPADAPQWAAVIDRKTKLMWAINPSKTASYPNPKDTMKWADAMAWAEYVNIQGWCGYHDWRLPTIDELRTLLLPRKQERPIDALKALLLPKKQSRLYLREDIFTDISDEYYWVWSASPVANGSLSAWIVHFSYGADYYGLKNSSSYVRLVRASQ